MPHELDKQQSEYAKKARSLVRGRNVLFHGTRYPSSILDAGQLIPAETGDPKVCFSRSPEEAAFWASLPRDDDEGRGAILIFDRDRLASRYRLELINDSEDEDEQEEYIWQREVPLHLAMIGLVDVPL